MDLDQAQALAKAAYRAVVEERALGKRHIRKVRSEASAATCIEDVMHGSEDIREAWRWYGESMRGFASWSFELQQAEVLRPKDEAGNKPLTEFYAAGKILLGYWLTVPGNLVVTAAPFADTRSNVARASPAVVFLYERFRELDPKAGERNKQRAYRVASRFRGMTLATN